MSLSLLKWLTTEKQQNFNLNFLLGGNWGFFKSSSVKRLSSSIRSISSSIWTLGKTFVGFLSRAKDEPIFQEGFLALICCVTKTKILDRHRITYNVHHHSSKECLVNFGRIIIITILRISNGFKSSPMWIQTSKRKILILKLKILNMHPYFAVYIEGRKTKTADGPGKLKNNTCCCTFKYSEGLSESIHSFLGRKKEEDETKKLTPRNCAASDCITEFTGKTFTSTNPATSNLRTRREVFCKKIAIKPL